MHYSQFRPTVLCLKCPELSWHPNKFKHTVCKLLGCELTETHRYRLAFHAPIKQKCVVYTVVYIRATKAFGTQCNSQTLVIRHISNKIKDQNKLTGYFTT